MGKRAPVHRFFCLLCAAALLFTVFFFRPVFAESAAERYRRLQTELNATRARIKDIRGNVAAAVELTAALEEQKNLIDEMVELNRQQIEATGAALAEKQAEVAEKRRVLYESDQLLRKRLVAVYDMNASSMLSRLLAVDSISEFLSMYDAMRRISRHDTDLLEMLAGQRAQLEAQQAEIDQLLAQLSAYHGELLQNQADLAEHLMAANDQLGAAQAQLAAQQAIEGSQYAALLQAQKEMAAIAGSIGGSKRGDGSAYVGGRLGWPVPGWYNTSCEFGQADPNGQPHGGMDITAPAGTSIAACNDGTVVQATYAHNSYGNYIVVDHGEGVKTLYAHCTALLASPGDAVKKGDVIATVGSTGFSTGNHLHLEVLDNGVRQNPRALLQA